MLIERFCNECGARYRQQREHSIYCSATCRVAANSRRVQGGFKIYPLVMQWRIERPKDALAELTAIADQLAKEERLIAERRDKRVAEWRAKHGQEAA